MRDAERNDPTPPPSPPDVSGRLADYLRELRLRADLSQRELSASSRVALATIGRLEAAGPADPRLSTVSRIVAAAGFRLLICDRDNRPIAPQPELFDICRDLSGRRLPAHLDILKAPDERYRLWWQPKRGLFTFVRDRESRDQMRTQNHAWVQRYLAERERDEPPE
jgi:transcriptional regulator with XRE-family HTH domain